MLKMSKDGKGGGGGKPTGAGEQGWLRSCSSWGHAAWCPWVGGCPLSLLLGNAYKDRHQTHKPRTFIFVSLIWKNIYNQNNLLCLDAVGRHHTGNILLSRKTWSSCFMCSNSSFINRRQVPGMLRWAPDMFLSFCRLGSLRPTACVEALQHPVEEQRCCMWVREWKC